MLYNGCYLYCLEISGKKGSLCMLSVGEISFLPQLLFICIWLNLWIWREDCTYLLQNA
jgi:hypothetical protein